MILLFIIIAFIAASNTFAQTWVDSVDLFARTVYLPPNQFFWSWQHSPMLHAMEIQYEMMPEGEKEKYFTYVKRSMDRSIFLANGTSPNAVASANGMAFLYRITGDPIYLQIAEEVYTDYLYSLRTSNGGVSHLSYAPELWDDSIYMIGVFFLAMYRATGDEQYIDELIDQFKAHKEKLVDEEWGLWVHGWDDNDVFNFDFCSQENWADPVTRRSSEFWGRGNGWIVVTLSELLNTLDEDHDEWDFVASALEEMIVRLPELQDENTGHWHQLPTRAVEEGNFLESSCTAMFGYGILTALKFGIVSGDEFEQTVENVYKGLRNHSIWPVDINGQEYYTSINVCGGTCIGDKDYYFERAVVNGEAYALAMFVIFGRAYESIYLDDVTTGVVNTISGINSFKIYPLPVMQNEPLTILINSTRQTTIKIEIIDIVGRIVFERLENLVSGENRKPLQIDEVQTGNYFVVLRDDNEHILISSPLIIQ